MLRHLSIPLLVVVAATVGCSEPVSFRADELSLVDRRIVPEHREQIEAALLEMFGTPDEPHVPQALEGLLDIELLRQAAGPVESQTPGVTTGLYRRHCARCHGTTGDGRGPTALYQNPYPRDFRPGVFKWKSTIRGAAPTPEDLHAVLERGVPGTAMPSFRLLREEERDALLEYVKYLTIRGQTERWLIEYVAEELDFDPETGEADVESRLSLEVAEDREMIDDWFQGFYQDWGGAIIKAELFGPDLQDPIYDAVDRITAGKELFHDTKRANCVKCHGEQGSGGVVLKEMDDWSKRRQDFLDATAALVANVVTRREQMSSAPPASHPQVLEQLSKLQRQIDERQAVAAEFLPPVTAQPRDLRGGVLRGGRPYNVVSEGVAGTPMPGVRRALSDEERVDLVAYVKSLLYPEGAPQSP